MDIFPVIQKSMIDYLLTRSEIEGVEVFPRIPAAPRPGRFVVISTAPATGNPKPVLSTRRIIAECWAPKPFQAGQLAETVRGLICDSKYHHIGVRRVNVIGEPGDFPHPTITDQVRWQVTADLLIRATA
ncbi:hypothetical protein [Mycolicibacterium sphagni]|uniref:DUF3168 domain-containing protein n=1 Tax=Mycolicibacterium sphagni TaxID=1786 RepID=A0A255DP17_9MYCO|nr:hypothetical protein [Mycolicibacterium sphagni]OYN80421.1 hypothetical protein CG716_09850 [Mycolicibacterium sphagni]